MDSLAYIDARLDELTNVIREAMSASAPKGQSAKQTLVSFPPRILANIREKNRLRRQWQINRDPTTKNRVNRLDMWIGIEVKGWRNSQCFETIVPMNLEYQSLWNLTCDSISQAALASFR